MKMAINQVAQTDAAKIAVQSAPAKTDAANANQTQSAASAPAPAKTQAATTDTVLISNSAKAMMQEAQETAAQTSQEAAKGDRQAQRLLEKEAAARAEEQGNNKAPTLSMK